MKRHFILIFVAMLVSTAICAAEINAAKEADIRQLMKVTGAGELDTQFAAMVSQAMYQNLKTAHPEVSDRSVSVMNRELSALFRERMSAKGGLLDQLVPLYDKYFTHQDVKNLLTFYSTPTGKKAVSLLPVITRESNLIGQNWGRSLAPEMQSRVKAALTREGILKEK